MKTAQSEIHNSNQGRRPNAEAESWRTRSVLVECGGKPSATPLSRKTDFPSSEHGVANAPPCSPGQSAVVAAALPTHSTTGLAFLLLLCVCSLPVIAQYVIDWYTIDGGGGTSTGGVYSVTGTIGQPDAGPVMTGGDYTLSGGFWALPIAVQTPGAPTLTITPATPGFATVSWTPATGTNWILQERLSLTAGSWANSPTAWTNPVVVPATLPAKFYRLFKP